VEIEMISGAHATGWINSYAGKWSQTSRIASTGGIDAGSGFVFESGLFVVGSLARSGDEILEDVGYLLCAF
jgi:hypothetical protein